MRQKDTSGSPVKSSFAQAMTDWKTGLTKPEKWGIQFWSESMEAVNAVRNVDEGRGWKVVDSEELKKAYDFLAAIKKAPDMAGTLWRGEPKAPEGVKEGQEFKFGKLISTSKVKSVTEEFTRQETPGIFKKVIYRIEALTGKDISSKVLEDAQEEQEVVIMKEAVFTVSKVEETKDIVFIDLIQKNK